MFVTTDFFYVSQIDKISIIKHVLVVWNISSLGPFCWRVLSDSAIMKLVHHVTSLDRPMWEMIWKKCSLHLIFTFYLNRDTSVVEFPLSMCLKKKRRFSLWGHGGPCWHNYLQLKLSLNCWIAVERAKITFTSIHIIAKQNSYHDDKSTLKCLTRVFCPQPIRNLRTRRHFDSSSIIALQVNFDKPWERSLKFRC